MTADTNPKSLPIPVVRALDAVRRRLHRVNQKTVAPPVAILETMTGAWVSRAVYAATKLAIPDALGAGPLTADDIAQKVGASADAVRRLLRMLASRGIFELRGGGRFALTPMSDALRSDSPASVRGVVLFFGDPLHWEHWGHLLYSVTTGEPSVDKLRGKPFFDFLEENREFAGIFNDAMTSVSDTETEPILAAYDFSEFRTIIDVGGGHGRLLAAILRQAPEARGILFDAQSVVAGAPAVFDEAGVANRCTAASGSFFESVPSDGDAYVLKHIIHDWDDANALQILRNIREAMRPDAKVLIMEAVIPDDNREHFAQLLDLEMLVAGTGKERSCGEYAELLRRAGLRMQRTVQTVGPASVIEAAAA